MRFFINYLDIYKARPNLYNMNIVYYFHDEKSVAAFETKIKWLKSHYDLISFDELIDSIYNQKKVRNACHITVDDGWRSTYDVIFPVLRKYKIPFTIFVSPKICREEVNFWYHSIKLFDPTDFMNFLIKEGVYKNGINRFPLDLLMKEIEIDRVYSIIRKYEVINNIKEGRIFMNQQELTELNDSGLVEIGAHTMIHPVLSNVSYNEAVYEIEESVNELNKLTLKPIRAFAYPNGLKDIDFGRREMEIVKKTGVLAAFSVDPGVFDNADPMSVPRVGSQKRLALGRLGLMLPSLSNQKGIRNEIRKYLK